MRESAVLLLVLVLSTAPAAAVLLPVKAVSKTIVVPDDYSSIQDAINAATEGNTIFIKRGMYEEPAGQTLVINKTLSLVGEDANNTIINLYPRYNETWILTTPFRTYSDAIAIEANNVEIMNLTLATNGGHISAIGEGIRMRANNIAGEVSVSGTHCSITENTVPILSLGLSYSNITGNNGNSICVNGSYNAVLQNYVLVEIALEYGDSNRLSNNTCQQLYLGLNNQNCSYNIISGNKVDWIKVYQDYSYTFARGVSIGAGSHNVFYDNFVANFNRVDGYGLWFDSPIAENNTFYHNTFINNTNHVGFNADPCGGSYVWDNGKEGNYWDDYNGTDSNRDGIGDTPYVISDGNIDNYPLMMPYDMENNTIVRPPPEPFPTATIIAITVTAAIAGIGLLVYFRKHKR